MTVTRLLILSGSAYAGILGDLTGSLGLISQGADSELKPAVMNDTIAAAPPNVVANPYHEMDLMCLSGPEAQVWFNVQQKMRYVLPPEAAFGQVSQELLQPALNSIMEDMSYLQNPNADYCGVGKLMMQLLSVIAQDENGGNIAPQLRNEKLTSPMLTLLLDIPWKEFQPMWPVFGFYAQIAMRRIKQHQNNDMVDGLTHPELQQFANALNYGILQGDLGGLNALATAYLETGGEGVQESPLAFVTALFTQAATTEKKDEAEDLFMVAQGVLKKMIHNVEDLDTTFASRWPLWGMAYLASLNSATAQ